MKDMYGMSRKQGSRLRVNRVSTMGRVRVRVSEVAGPDQKFGTEGGLVEPHTICKESKEERSQNKVVRR